MGKLKICKVCNKEVGYIYDDGVCGHCKHYIICKSCNKEIHDSHMLKSGICEYCDKAERKIIEELKNSYKLCPFCGEEIKAMAIKCRFCNEMLEKRIPKIVGGVEIIGETSVLNKTKNEIKQEIISPTVTNKNRWFAGYIVAGLIWTFAASFRKTAIDEVIVLLVAIGAGFFYHKIKSKIRIKNEAIRIIVTFIIIEFAAGLLVGLLTGLVNRIM